MACPPNHYHALKFFLTKVGRLLQNIRLQQNLISELNYYMMGTLNHSNGVLLLTGKIYALESYRYKNGMVRFGNASKPFGQYLLHWSTRSLPVGQ